MNTQSNTKVQLVLTLNEMGLQHPIPAWDLNGKHTGIKLSRGEEGGVFVFTPERNGGGWVDS